MFGKKKRFPWFAIILLILGVIWLLSDLSIISANIPWGPVLVILVAVVWIFKRIYD